MYDIKTARKLCADLGMYALSDNLENEVDFSKEAGDGEVDAVENWLGYVEEMKHACETILKELETK